MAGKAEQRIKETILPILNAMKAEALKQQDQTLGQLSGMERGQDGSDYPFQDNGSDIHISTISSRSKYLQQIEDAIWRLENGTYGNCQNCGQPIPLSRLEAAPFTKLCLPCKTAEEEKQKPPKRRR